ncbi:hypothetical protein EJB05_31702, partial [Eragrostis curvula]
MLPPLLLLLAFFLQGAAAASPGQPSSCLPKKCGSLNISYPFWLDEPGQPPCGPPAFQLKCNSSGAFLSRSIYQAYRMVSIFLDNSSFHVIDDNLPLANGCPAPNFNISLGIGLGPFVISRSNYELLFLTSCKEPPPNGFHRLPCRNLSFVSDGGEAKYGSYHGQDGIPPSCVLSVVPTLGASDRNGNDHVAKMKNGFLLQWEGLPTDCPKCMASGGECMYGDTGLAFACNCSDGVHHEKCGVV